MIFRLIFALILLETDNLKFFIFVIPRTGDSRYVDFAYLDTISYVDVIFPFQLFFSIYLCISTPSVSKTVNMKQRVSRGDFSCPRPIFCYFCYWGARWLSGIVSDSGARGPGFETYRRRVVSLSKTLYSPKVLVNYPGSDGSVPT